MEIYVYLYTYMYIYPRLTINTEHQSDGILVVSVHPVYRERGCISMGRCSDRQWGDYASCVFLSSTKHIKKVSNTKKRKIISKYKRPLPIVNMQPSVTRKQCLQRLQCGAEWSTEQHRVWDRIWTTSHACGHANRVQ